MTIFLETVGAGLEGGYRVVTPEHGLPTRFSNPEYAESPRSKILVVVLRV